MPAVAAAILGASSVVATEMQASMAQLGENLLANGHTRISARCLDWREPLPADLIGDLILACDCTYNASLHAPLVANAGVIVRKTTPRQGLNSVRRGVDAERRAHAREIPEACVENGLVIGEIPDGAWRRWSPPNDPGLHGRAAAAAFTKIRLDPARLPAARDQKARVLGGRRRRGFRRLEEGGRRGGSRLRFEPRRRRGGEPGAASIRSPAGPRPARSAEI